MSADDPLCGDIILVAFRIEPDGWAFCDGRLLAITAHVGLFSLIGTTYGGDGTATFALPDLDGRIIVGTSEVPGGAHSLGERNGEAAHTLTAAQMPAHGHVVQAAGASANVSAPAGNLPATASDLYAPPPSSTATTLSPATIGSTGGGQPHPNMQPYVVLNYLINLNGPLPSS